jgi:ABC-type transport system substrate-binding protein
MYQPLFAVDNNKNVTPILCSKFQVSANSRNWTVYLEENATFSDGSRVTPEDVIATYTQAKANDYYANRFYHLWEMAVTEDGKGVIVRLYNPQNCSFETVVKTAPVLGFASCKKVDLLENTVEELALEPKLQVGPYEIISLRFE